MSTYAGHSTWPQFQQRDHRTVRLSRTASRSQKSKVGSTDRSWNVSSAIRGLFHAIWFATYAALNLGSLVVIPIVAVLLIPFIVFAPVFLVAGFLQAATWVLSGLGLI